MWRSGDSIAHSARDALYYRVTESRVSQLHTKALLRLKARLSGAQARAAVERS